MIVRSYDCQVTRQEYESCHIYSERDAHMVVNCSNPLRRKRFTILFEEFQAIPNVSEFVPGSTYYYISKSLPASVFQSLQGSAKKRGHPISLQIF